MNFLEKQHLYNKLGIEKSTLEFALNELLTIDDNKETITTSYLKLDLEGIYDNKQGYYQFWLDEKITDDIVCALYDNISRLRKEIREIERQIKEIEES